MPPKGSLRRSVQLRAAHFIFEILLKPGSKLSPESLVFGAVVKVHLGNPLDRNYLFGAPLSAGT